jgi:7-carboxy-7-deazaguanine synthase
MTWHVRPEHEIDIGTMIAKTEDAPTWARLDDEDLAMLVGEFRARHVVFTGGEPALYDLREVSRRLIDEGRTVQLETSGTAEIKIDPHAWVTVSPKIDMPGGLKVLPAAVARANEIKMPVGKPADVEKLKAFLAEHPAVGVAYTGPGPAPLIWLQPLSQSDKATALCLEAAAEHGWRLSLQTHKYLGVR